MPNITITIVDDKNITIVRPILAFDLTCSRGDYGGTELGNTVPN